MHPWLKAVLKLLGLLAAFTLGYLALLGHPQSLFSYDYAAENLHLYSDDPLPPPAAQALLTDVQARLSRSPLYAARPEERIFLCNRAWRYRLLFNGKFNAGGHAYGPWPHNVYLRKSDVGQGVLYRADGRTPSGPDRPLAYFVAHEITHNLITLNLGLVEAWRLPGWKNEGYADYVARAGYYQFQGLRARFLAGDPDLDPSRSGLYLRYQLFVAELLEERHLSVEAMLRSPLTRGEIERSLALR